MIAISVIVPNYNYCRFLTQRMESIFNQSYRNIEIILLDDGSDDGSRQLLETYRHHPLVKALLVNDTNSGSPFIQWKRGMEAARNEWIWIAEADDFCEPTFLEECVRKIEENPSVLLVTTGNCQLDETGEKKIQKNREFEQEGLKKGRTVLSDFLIYQNPVPNASGVVFSKRWIPAGEIEQISRFLWCGDWALWAALCLRGDVYFIDKPLNVFRRHGRETSKTRYEEGFLYKEGLPLSLEYQNRLKVPFRVRRKALWQWAGHLFRQYSENLKKGKFRLYLFSPLYYCALMHAALPFIALRSLAKKK